MHPPVRFLTTSKWLMPLGEGIILVTSWMLWVLKGLRHVQHLALCGHQQALSKQELTTHFPL